MTTEWYHNPNSTEINKQWAKSGHAGKIASATPDTGTVWGHYSWDDTAGRGSCQRCHTATGAKNFLTLTGDGDPATTYVANGTGNDFSHLAGWTATNKNSQQNELLYCWACHSDVATGALNNPGAITEVYTGSPTGAPSVTVVYPDITESNVCMGCHLGREVGQNIMVSTGDFTNLSFINSHYLTAGATLFNESGFEYNTTITPGNTAAGPYNDFGYHKNIGTPVAVGTGTVGPCVTCHMTGTESHSFEVVTKDATGVITAVATTVCVNCHDGMTATALETSKEEFETAMDALKTALEGKGIFFKEAHPYFYQSDLTTAFKNWDGVNVGTTAAPITGKGKEVMGAAFNFNLFEHDPGAYAHNRSYALKLIADSIDFLNDGAVDGDRNAARVGINVGTVDSSANPLHTTAIADVLADPATGPTICASCHRSASHFGGNANSTSSTPAQWVAPFAGVFKPCDTCHANEDIAANAVILDQYATANHGDVLGAWNHVSTTAPTITTIGGTDYQTWCGRCHTTQGFIDQEGDNVSNAPIQLWPTVAGQTTLDAVACDACHTDVATAETRVLGTYTTSYYSTATAFNVAVDKLYPDVGPSSICVRCHSGRDSAGIGELIKVGTPVAAATVLRTHYLGSALTLFNTGGYHFGVTDYTTLGSHKNIAAVGAGPCVTCHMSGTAGHTFWPIEEDETTGTITAILSSACTDCHAAAMTAAYLTEVRNDFKTVKNALEAALEAKGIFYRNELETVGSTGRFYSSAAHTTELTYSSTTPSYTSLAAAYTTPPSAQDLMGAAFNLAFMDYIQEPGAYAHNWEYARRLLIDSIDLVADGAINGAGIPAAVVAIDAKY